MVRVEIAGPWSMVAIAQIIDVSVTPSALEGSAPARSAAGVLRTYTPITRPAAAPGARR